jgi:cytochrome oxidase Cu insertion factor (SCO1/SenC/PrrC family)
VLARVWQAYGIAEAVTGRDVLHSDVIYLIDKKERGRVLLHSIVTAETLASDLSLLANER